MSDRAQARAALECARGIHAEFRDANRDLYTRAQIVLTLDGIVLGALGAALATQPDDLRDTVAVFAGSTWAGMGVAGAAMIASVLSSALALFSRHMQGPRQRRGNVPEAAYEPATMWYYARVAELNPVRFVEVAVQADAAFEVRARLAQVAVMAPIMVRRAQWLNRAFACTALAFVSFALAAADYLIRLAS
jgi:hypothetical protein